MAEVLAAAVLDGTNTLATNAIVAFPVASVMSGASTLSLVTKVTTYASIPMPGVAPVSIGIMGQVTAQPILMGGKGSLILHLPFPYTIDPSIGREPYRLVVVDQYGTAYEELENAQLGQVSWLLNDIGSFDFSLATDDPKIQACIVPEREVQVWRGTQLIWWGVLVRARGDHQTVNFQAQTLEWYFTRRVLGKVPVPDLLVNGDFELLEGNWTFEYGNLAPDTGANATPPGHNIVTDPVLAGKRALRLTSTLTGNHKWARQKARYRNASGRVITATCVAWSYLKSYAGPAAGECGLVFARYDTIALDPHPALAAQGLKKIHDYKVSFINADTPLNAWVRHEITLDLPPDFLDYDLTARLHVPNGEVVWEEASITIGENVYFDTDQASIVEGLVRLAQDTGAGKSALNIGTLCPSSGVRRKREYLTTERQQFSEALFEFGTLHDGVEIGMLLTPTTRQVRTYYPRMGRDNDTALTLGGNILSFSVDVDATLTASTVIVQAEGEGSDREEGIATDASLLNGLILETVYNATPGSAQSSLQAQADRGLARYRRPVTIPSVTTQQGMADLLTQIGLGDRVPVYIDKGWIQARGKYRVTGITLEPTTDQITFTLVPEDAALSTLLDWAATGWKYLSAFQDDLTTGSTTGDNTLPVQTHTEYAAYDFNDSTWATGQSAIGWSYGTGGFEGKTPRNTEIPEKHEVWMRKHVKVTSDMILYTRVDNFGFLYVNGNLIVKPFIESRDANDAYVERGPFRVPQEFLRPDGDQVITLHVQDKLSGYGPGDIFVGDVKVVGVYDQYAAESYVPPAPPYTPVLAEDTFNRADEAALVTTSSGHAYINGENGRVVANQCELRYGATGYPVLVDAGRNDVVLTFTVIAIPNDANGHVAQLRSCNPGNAVNTGIHLDVYGNGTIYLGMYDDDGVPASRNVNYAGPLPAGHVYRLRVQADGTLEALIDGVVRLTLTMTAEEKANYFVAGRTKHGMWHNGAFGPVKVDDFSVTSP